MPENEGQRKADKLDVRLNEAFERLEKRNESGTGRRDERITSSKSSPAGFFLAIFFSLIAMGAAGYAAYMVYMMPPVSGQIASLERRMEQLQADSREETGEVHRMLTALNKEVDQLRATRLEEVDAVKAQVDAAIAELRQSTGTSSEDWLMAEVEYLLRLANHRVLLERDPGGAVALFEAADRIVQDAEGITAFELRKAIASDIAKLKAVRSVDVDGIFVRLSALKGLVGDLRQRKLEYRPEPQETEATVDNGAPQGFIDRAMALLRQAGTKLGGLVQYRTGGEKIRPILPPEEEYYLRQNLVLKVQLAQLALLRGDQEIYARSLVESRRWVAGNFDPDDSVTKAVLQDIDELMNVDIAREMPDVSESLREARDLLADFHQVEDSGSGQ